MWHVNLSQSLGWLLIEGNLRRSSRSGNGCPDKPACQYSLLRCCNNTVTHDGDPWLTHWQSATPILGPATSIATIDSGGVLELETKCAINGKFHLSIGVCWINPIGFQFNYTLHHFGSDILLSAGDWTLIGQNNSWILPCCEIKVFQQFRCSKTPCR